MMSLAQAAQWLDARFEGADQLFESVSTDTRTLAPGALFVALEGEHHDGHDYIDAAMGRGAAGVVSRRPSHRATPTILVDDTLVALQQLAARWRRRFDCPVVAVTGSNGKTTVKEMIGSILAGMAPTLVSVGNLNNHIGVPLSLLRLRDEHRYAVIEMGMNHAGELTRLSALAAPDVALINNAAAAHLEGLGSIEGVAAAKGEIFSGLSADGVACINADDPFANYWLDLNRNRRRLTFGFDTDAGVRGAADTRTDHSLMRISYDDTILSPRLPVGGVHNARNALAAATVAVALGVSDEQIVAGLESFAPVRGRGALAKLSCGATLIDDTYNANPASAAAAIDLLSRYPGQRILVLGDMSELGADAAHLHRDTGLHARRAGIERLLGLGPLSALACEAFGAGAQSFDSIDQLLGVLAVELDADTTLLIKGSRSMRMERIVTALEDHEPAAEVRG